MEVHCDAKLDIVELDCEATVNGDQMTGKVNAGAFGDMALTGERQG